ncbi:MAG: amidohydrolase family protein [Oscillospiraceae bacterium]
MKIIDAHLHFFDKPNFDSLALAAGHENSAAHLKKVFCKNNIAHAVVMGNGGISFSEHDYPDFVSFCIGINADQLRPEAYDDSVSLAEEQLRLPACAGIKLYPGYTHHYVFEPLYEPFFALSRKYGKPVAVHTGATAGTMGILKYSHPLTLDETAIKYPDVSIVMCHFGNPWLTDAAALMAKNRNISTDLSGILEGKPDIGNFAVKYLSYIEYIKTWLQYVNSYDRIMFGTDWPLVNIPSYIAFTKLLIPEEYWENVFFKSANTIYRLGL